MQMVDQVLELNETGLEQALVTQAHLLEETDINNVLNTIQVDEFSDLFTGMYSIKIITASLYLLQYNKCGIILDIKGLELDLKTNNLS